MSNTFYLYQGMAGKSGLTPAPRSARLGWRRHRGRLPGACEHCLAECRHNDSCSATVEVSALVSGTPAVPPLAFLWDFDGAAAQAGVLSPGSVTFATPGVFTLTLTARDGNSSIVAQQTRTITVLASEITLTPGRHGHVHAQRTGHLYGRAVGHRQRRLRGQRDAADQRDRGRERGDYPTSACGTLMGACRAAWCSGAERNPARCPRSVRRTWYKDHVSKIRSPFYRAGLWIQNRALVAHL